MVARIDIEEAIEEVEVALGEHLRLAEGTALSLGGQDIYEDAVAAVAALQQFFEEELA